MRQCTLEDRLGRLLGVGTWFVSAVLLLGLLLHGMRLNAGLQFLKAGIGSIIALPVIRVAMMAFDFARHREWRFAVIAAIVFLVIVVSTAAGFYAV